MANGGRETHRHFILEGVTQTEKYRSRGGGSSRPVLPQENRPEHAARLRMGLSDVRAAVDRLALEAEEPVEGHTGRVRGLPRWNSPSRSCCTKERASLVSVGGRAERKPTMVYKSGLYGMVWKPPILAFTRDKKDHERACSTPIGAWDRIRHTACGHCDSPPAQRDRLCPGRESLRSHPGVDRPRQQPTRGACRDLLSARVDGHRRNDLVAGHER